MGSGITVRGRTMVWKIGLGASRVYGIEAQAGTVVAVRNNGETVVWQRDKAIHANYRAVYRDLLKDAALPGSGSSGWIYKRDPDGEKEVYTFRDGGNWIQQNYSENGGSRLISGRIESKDSF